ncbi:MAG: HD-GYP domain-containing protein [Treponema sp.]|jgi:HD-GYP domain-containing protein (c-di-GMP phosphodiesterase class II)|nr:HD-GYP domain-containing protein [Treponema sp.]
MKKIEVKSLRAGLIFTQPVFIEGNNLLVPAGIAVRKKDIERLSSWGIETVETDGEVTQASRQNFITPEEPPKTAVSSPLPAAAQENKGVYQTYQALIEELDVVFSHISSQVSSDIAFIEDITERLFRAVQEQRDSMVRYILGGEIAGREMAKNSLNTAILSTLIAMELNIPNYKILQIIIGALLHDVGMLRIPKEIVEKKGGLSKEELRSIQTHPLHTYQIICKELGYPEEVGAAAFQHHERWDGGGYPRRLAGEAIDLGARIISVADAFEAMVSRKPYRNSLMGYQAMKNLLSDNSRRFDPNILRAFIKTMGIYPIGSIILLNNGNIARVVEVQGTAPLRPKIRILMDKAGKTYKKDEGNVINLLAEKDLFIARAMDLRELTKGHE